MAGSYILRSDGRTLKFDVTNSVTHEGAVILTDHPVERGANISDHARKDLARVTLEVTVSNAPIRSDLRDGAEATVTINVAGYVPAGRKGKIPLDVKPYEPSLSPTPGAVFGAVGRGIRGLFGGVKGYAANVSPGPSFGRPARYQALVLQFDRPFDAVAETLGHLDSLQNTAELVTVITTERDYENMVLERFTAPKDRGDSIKISMEFRQVRVVTAKVVSVPVKNPAAAKKVDKGAQSSKSAEEVKESILSKLVRMAG